jgi:hypothetical protein
MQALKTYWIRLTMAGKNASRKSREIIILVSSNGDYRSFSDKCYRKTFQTDEDFLMGKADLIVNGLRTGSVEHEDGTYIAFANQDRNMAMIPFGYSSAETPKKYLDYIRDLRSLRAP